MVDKEDRYKNRVAGLFLFALASGYAQDTEPTQTQPKSGIVLHLGPSINYFQGQQSGSHDEFNRKRINFQLNAFLGYQSARGNGGNSIGVFGTAGYTNAFTLDEIIAIQDIIFQFFGLFF